MKFEITKDIIVGAFNKVVKVVKNNTHIPILQGILVEVSFDEIKITGSDSRETVVTKIVVDGENVKVMEEGNTVFPRQIAEIVKKSGSSVAFSLENFTNTITSGKSEFKLNSFDPKEYPRFPDIELRQPNLVVTGEQFKDMVRKTVFAASKSDTRPVLTGVLMEIQEDCIELVCTDSHRLAMVTQKAVSPVPMQLIVSADSLANASKVFDMDKDVELFTISESQHVLLRNGETIFLSRLLDGNFPQIKQAIPKKFANVVKINRNDLLNGFELIRGIANIADNETKGVAKLHVNGVASLSSYEAQTGKGKVDIVYDEVIGDEPEFTISCSIAYVIDSLKSLDSGTVDICYNDPLQPIIIAPSEESDFKEVQLLAAVRASN
ncbi:DNA polymerase III subunit beta [Bacillus alkalicellulosilyticus]|uniref:DNA polymerase III subunit beta n=1 Tax=Alkalihalobacterium alkalicellulosilyticum TaxID=1912214 RepID=UPI0009971987|nr:DNA polymerase III subunit beta [Bacillus alkalicellulosilyticus]